MRDFMVTPVRRLALPAMSYFHVSSGAMPVAELDAVLDGLIADLHTAMDAAALRASRADLLRHVPHPDGVAGDLRVMDIGVPVPDGTGPSGRALVKPLPAFACAAVLVWGGFDHVADGYSVLDAWALETGNRASGEWREWYFHVDDDDPAQNVIGLHMGLL